MRFLTTRRQVGGEMRACGELGTGGVDPSHHAGRGRRHVTVITNAINELDTVTTNKSGMLYLVHPCN